MAQTQIHAPCGTLNGKQENGIYEFLGIPYAHARRFQKPEPVTWTGVRDCLAYGAAPPQPNYRGKKPTGWTYQMLGSEDCLNLNVWTRHPGQSEALRPVVVFVYGGAFQVGSNSMPAGAGDRFMEQEDMVYVSVNYRVGVLGFLELEDYGDTYRGSGNCGMWDLLTALRWIRTNISSFGGDPEGITLMGISAGAKAIGALLTLPEVQEICHSIILESGAMQAFRSRETALSITALYRSYLPDQADLLTLPAEQLVEAQAELCAREGCTCFWGPVLESPFALDWREQWKAGQRFRGRALIGCGRHELVGLVQNPGFLNRASQVAQDMFGVNGTLAIEKQKELVSQGIPVLEAWEQVFSDFMYRFYSDTLAQQLERDGNHVWVYSFEFPPARHGQGFFFLQGEVEKPENPLSPARKKEALALSHFFRGQVRKFILLGEPDPAIWRPYQGGWKMVLRTDPHMEFRPHDTLTGFPEEVFSRVSCPRKHVKL